jgi:hypothetical protein
MNIYLFFQKNKQLLSWHRMEHTEKFIAYSAQYSTLCELPLYQLASPAVESIKMKQAYVVIVG